LNELYTSTFDKIPDELIVKIVENMPIRTLIQFSESSKKFNTIVNDPQNEFWKSFCKRDFPDAQAPQNGNFKEAYRNSARRIVYQPKQDLKTAIEKNNIDQVKDILNQYPSVVKCVYENGETPIHLASYYTDILSLLLEMPLTDVNAQDDQGRTVLHKIAKEWQWGSRSVLELLLKNNKVDVNLRDNLGNTALYHAVTLSTLENFKLILEAPGVKINSKNKLGVSAFGRAYKEGRLEMIRMLLPSQEINDFLEQCNGSTELHFQAMRGNIKRIKELLTDKELNINQQDEKGWGALHWAAFCGQTETAKLLLSSPQINVNLQSKRREESPLHFSCIHGYYEIVESLLSTSGIDPNIKRMGGNTPLHEAIFSPNQKIPQLLITLPEIDINLADNGGCTALHYAIDKGDLTLIKSLLERKEIDIHVVHSEKDSPYTFAKNSGNQNLLELFSSILETNPEPQKKKKYNFE
jgi:ankyrin repeat protein